MKQTTRNLLGSASNVLSGIAVAGLLIGPAFGLVVPQQFSPRQLPDQQTHYLRFTVNWNDCNFTVTSTTCSVKRGAVPYNSFIVRAYQQVIVQFNATTNNNLAIGTVGCPVVGNSVPPCASPPTGFNNIVANQSVGVAPGAATALTVAGLGLNATGSGSAGAQNMTGANGGFDIWTNYSVTGASLPTAGQAVIVIEYIAPNDGGCAPVAIGTTTTSTPPLPGAC